MNRPLRLQKAARLEEESKIALGEGVEPAGPIHSSGWQACYDKVSFSLLSQKTPVLRHALLKSSCRVVCSASAFITTTTTRKKAFGSAPKVCLLSRKEDKARNQNVHTLTHWPQHDENRSCVRVLMGAAIDVKGKAGKRSSS
jgi:hypothetical protein